MWSGPHEVFAGATRAAAALGRAGRLPGHRRPRGSGGPVRAESGLELGTASLPGAAERIDTLVLAGGTGADAASADQALVAWIAGDRPALPPGGHRVLGRASSAPRPACSRGAG